LVLAESGAPERVCGARCKLLGRDVAYALGDVPAMPERVDDLAVALAPELISEFVAHLGARSETPRPERVRVVGLDLEDSGR